MKLHTSYKKILGCNNEDEVFDFILSSLSKGITTWNYFVNWEKVIRGYSEIEVALNTLNYLVGKDNPDEQLMELLNRHPEVRVAFPVLIAARNKRFRILTDPSTGTFTYLDFDFSSTEPMDRTEQEKVVMFARESGILKLLEDKTLKSLPDYALGVEVGLDSNGRKNRGGTIMEEIVEGLIASICEKHGLEYITQATPRAIAAKWDRIVSVDKTTRRTDFAIFNGKDLFLVETNFYNSGGSKLKATAGEYKELGELAHKDGNIFIWITDGQGWVSTKRPLHETFNSIDFLLNLEMCRKGILEEIIKDPNL